MCKEKKQSAYLLATGSEATDDYDVNVGVFLDEDALKQAYLQLIERKQQEMKQQGYSIVETIKIYKLLKRYLDELTLIANNSKAFSRSLVVIPSYMAKGLEYDATIVYTEKENEFTYDERYLYYVACTRSQHHLIIYNQKETN